MQSFLFFASYLFTTHSILFSLLFVMSEIAESNLRQTMHETVNNCIRYSVAVQTTFLKCIKLTLIYQSNNTQNGEKSKNKNI